MPCALACAMSPAATARTWETPPGLPSTWSVLSVCTESTIASEGRTCSRCPSARPRSASAARSRVSSSAPIRSARRRTCEADSSPVR